MQQFPIMELNQKGCGTNPQGIVKLDIKIF